MARIWNVVRLQIDQSSLVVSVYMVIYKKK